jgi:DNA adenine methylase
MKKNLGNKKVKTKTPHPFLKWAGGKRQLLSQIEPVIPDSFNTYLEPFVGGGALFFHLTPKQAILIDNNPVLINAYKIIQNNVEDLIKSLQKHKNEKEYYYKIRNVDLLDEFEEWSDIEKASRILFMNKCCYNGLYRVNSKGHFNVPFGKYKNPNFCDEINLRAVHKALQGVKIILGSFEMCLKYAKRDDFVYFDPPYHPLSDTANFTGYTKEKFGKKEQENLKRVFDELNERGCKVLLSNSYTDFILNLYKEYNILSVTAKRAINRDASKRGKIKELLISNYPIKSEN